MLGRGFSAVDHATHRVAAGRISGSEVPLVELERAGDSPTLWCAAAPVQTQPHPGPTAVSSTRRVPCPTVDPPVVPRVDACCSPLAGLRDRDTKLCQEAAVVGLHPLLGQAAFVVVPEGTDHFPLEVLPSRLERTDGREGEEPGEVTRERGARRQEAAVHDDLFADKSQPTQRGPQRREVSAQFIEAQLGVWSVEDVVL
jgi:hypothetical protein